MRGHVLPVSLVLAAAACGARGPAAPLPPERSYDNPGLGVSFAIPAEWVDDAVGAAVVLGGPAGTPSYFTPLTLQASPRGAVAPDLDRVLTATWEHPAGDAPPTVRARVPALVAGAQALRYLVAFDLHEVPRLRAGVLLRHGGSVVDLAYVAPRDLFAANLLVFERALATLALAPPDGGEP
jgi:hypothetical protein